MFSGTSHLHPNQLSPLDLITADLLNRIRPSVEELEKRLTQRREKVLAELKKGDTVVFGGAVEGIMEENNPMNGQCNIKYLEIKKYE